jgi:hypothetical protein
MVIRVAGTHSPTHFWRENLLFRANFETLLSDWLDRQTYKHFRYRRPALSEKGVKTDLIGQLLDS